MPTSSVGVIRSNPKGTDRSVHCRRSLIGRTSCALGQSSLSPPDARNRRRGVTLIEMLIVMALVALVAGMAAPSVSAGLDSLRLRSTSDAMIGFFNTALARADTRQQVVEILISPAEGTMTAISADRGFQRRLEIASPIKILSVQPSLMADGEDQNQTRRFLVYPGGSVPKIAIEIGNAEGRKRLVSIDPITGVPRADAK